MIQYLAIRTIAIILGLCSMFVALFVFMIDLVGSINNVDPTNDYYVLGLIIILIGSGAATMAAPKFIFKKQFKKIFIPTCIIVGIGYLIGYFFTSGSFQPIFEILLVVMALLYFGLAYLIHLLSVEV